jgi:hypothetical protein
VTEIGTFTNFSDRLSAVTTSSPTLVEVEESELVEEAAGRMTAADVCAFTDIGTSAELARRLSRNKWTFEVISAPLFFQ